MALDKDRLGNAIVDRIKTLIGEPLEAGSEAELRVFWKAISDEIITEFIDNAEILIDTFTAVAPGVTPGVGNSANITGTATGVIEE